jgi:hypothetical protein
MITIPRKNTPQHLVSPIQGHGVSIEIRSRQSAPENRIPAREHGNTFKQNIDVNNWFINKLIPDISVLKSSWQPLFRNYTYVEIYCILVEISASAACKTLKSTSISL